MLEKEKKRILLKLDEMDKYAAELKEMLPSESKYLSDIVERRACEKTAELALESMIDICSMIVSAEKMGMPSDEEDIIDMLVKERAISEKLGKILKKMKGFRNILVHKYGEIDDSLAYETLSEELDDFAVFRKEIISYLS